MLIVALFTVIGGERLARSEVEERIPADRDKLLDFSSALGKELEWLDETCGDLMKSKAFVLFFSQGPCAIIPGVSVTYGNR